MTLRLLFATHNRHKVEELRALVGAHLPAGALQVETLAEHDLPEPVEDGETFEDNARIKALAAYQATGLWSLADDSGLECDALAGAPGVHSARYAGEPRSDARNLQKLLTALEQVPEARRTARFRCALCLVGPREFVRAGVCEGTLLRAPRGQGGFGYDPIFVPRPEEAAALGLPTGVTLAELRAEEKNRLSHRARALMAMVPVLAEALQG